jgi:hypothetical protein
MAPTVQSLRAAVFAANEVTMPRNSPPTIPVVVTNASLFDYTSKSLSRFEVLVQESTVHCVWQYALRLLTYHTIAETQMQSTSVNIP